MRRNVTKDLERGREGRSAMKMTGTHPWPTRPSLFPPDDRVGYSAEIEGGWLDMSKVLEPIFKQAGDALGRKFEYPKK